MIMGIELSPYMIETGRLTTLSGMRKVELMEGSVLDLPYPDDSFQGATACFLFHEMPADCIRRALEEIYRVLLPGGRLSVRDPVVGGSWIARGHYALYHALTYEPYLGNFMRMDIGQAFRDAGFSRWETHHRLYGAIGLRIAVK
jgi:ubiquinone/menaquinone biosynthesis C-methylase UbiE